MAGGTAFFKKRVHFFNTINLSFRSRWYLALCKVSTRQYFLDLRDFNLLWGPLQLARG